MTNDTPNHVEQLQADSMELLLHVQKQVRRIEELTADARIASRLYVRAHRVSEAFADRAETLQQRATSESIRLSLRRAQHLLLTQRLEYLAWQAGDNPPVQLSRAGRDLKAVEKMITTWATDPRAERDGDDLEQEQD